MEALRRILVLMALVALLGACGGGDNGTGENGGGETEAAGGETEATDGETEPSASESTPTPTPETPCDPVENPEELEAEHLDKKAFPIGQYSSNPPTSGPHSTGLIDVGTIYDKPQNVGDLLHAMNHGTNIMWFNPDVLSTEETQAAKDAINDVYGKGYQSLIATPYTDMEAALAMTAWGHLQQCREVDAQAIADFVENYYASGPEGHIACTINVQPNTKKLPPCRDKVGN